MKFWTLSLLLLLSTLTSSQTENFTIEEVMSAPFPTGLVGHPSEDLFAWVFNDKGERNVWVCQDGESREITTFLGDNGQSISNIRFSPHAQTLLFHRGASPNRQGELPNPNSQALGVSRDIFEYNYYTDTLIHLTEGQGALYAPHDTTMVYIKKGSVFHYDLVKRTEVKLFSVRGGISQLTWHPEGTAIAFRSSRGDHSFIGIFNFGQKEIEFISPSVDLDAHPIWSSDGAKIAFIKMPNQRNALLFEPRRSGTPWSIHVYDYANSKSSKEVWKADEGRGSVYRSINAKDQLMFTQDDRLVFAWEGNGYTNLYSLSMFGQLIPLTPGPFEVQFVTHGHDDQIYASSNEQDVDRQHIYKINPRTGNKTKLTQGLGIEWLTATNGASKLACLGSSWNQPAHPQLILPIPGPLVTSMTPFPFPTEHLVQPEQVIFSSADGMLIHGQLFKPKGSAKQKYPAAIFFHGGSRRQMLLGFHHSSYYHNAYALNQYLADQGYVVLSVNYRSGIGYGMEFREALEYGATGASEYNDVIGAGLYLQGRDDVAMDKIGLWGGSYGGYLTALGLARASDLFAAGVDIHGVHDWNVVIKNFRPSYNAEKREAFAKLAFESSPMADIDTWRSPVLVIHGDDDRNVPFSESVDLVESLRPLGVHIEQLIFPDEVHGFLLHKNWVNAYKASADFFNRMLRDK